MECSILDPVLQKIPPPLFRARSSLHNNISLLLILHTRMLYTCCTVFVSVFVSFFFYCTFVLYFTIEQSSQDNNKNNLTAFPCVFLFIVVPAAKRIITMMLSFNCFLFFVFFSLVL